MAQQNNGLPKVHKKTSFYIFAALAGLQVLAAISAIFSTNWDEKKTAIPAIVLAIVFAAVAYALYRRNSREATTYAAALEKQKAEKQARAAKALAEQEAKKALQAEWDRTHGRIVTPIAGVTFDNADGTSRQRLLKDALANDCCGSLELQAYDYKGEQAVRVLFEGEQIGNIPRSRAEEVAAVLDRISAAHLDVSRFVPEEDEGRGIGGVIYRADLTMVYLKEQ